MSRDYFDGCNNVPLFVDEAKHCAFCGKPLAYIGIHEDNSPTAMVAKCWGRYVDHDHAVTPSLADAVAAAEARRSDGGQLVLPAELLPVASGEMFA